MIQMLNIILGYRMNVKKYYSEITGENTLFLPPDKKIRISKQYVAWLEDQVKQLLIKNKNK